MRSNGEESKASLENLPRGHLPYPVARAVRGVQVAIDPWRKYDQVIEASEKLVTWLGILGLAWICEEKRLPPAIAQWMDGLRGSGLSLGMWLAVAQAAEKEMGTTGTDLDGFSQGLRAQKGNAGLRGALESLVNERNDRAHGRGPRTDAELEDRLVEASNKLAVGLQGAGFLRELPAFIPQRCSFSRRTGDFTITALALIGEHPDFAPMSLRSEHPLEEQQIYLLRKGEEPLLLTPFCVARDCPRCRSRELFYPERLIDGELKLKSLDEGHLTEDPDLALDLPVGLSTSNASGDAGVIGAPLGKEEPKPIETSEEDVERRFHREMVSVYEEAKREAGYTATRFLQMISELGGLEAARQLLHAAGASDGFTALWEKGRLDLSVEARVLKPLYEGLFSDEEREIARKRLGDYGYVTR